MTKLEQLKRLDADKAWLPDVADMGKMGDGFCAAKRIHVSGPASDDWAWYVSCGKDDRETAPRGHIQRHVQLLVLAAEMTQPAKDVANEKA